MKILIGYDGSACADAALEDLTYGGFPSNTEALVVSVAHAGWPPPTHSSKDQGQFASPWNATMKDTEAYANKAGLRVQSLFPAWKVSSEPLWGDPTDILLKTAEHWKPDVLVLGSHGRGALGRLALGSVSLKLVHHAPCAVRISRLPKEDSVDRSRILIAIDGSEHAESMLGIVARRFWPEGTQAKVIAILQTLVPTVGDLVPTLEGRTFATEPAFNVIEAEDARQLDRLHDVVDASAERLESAGLNVSSTVVDGDARTSILKEATQWHAGTIFVGARGLGAMDRLLLGSVSTAVVTHAGCIVEVVRPGLGD